MAWKLVLTAASLAALAAAPLGRAAEPLPYPVRVVTLVTHSSPGGGSDVFLRELIRYLGSYIDATFIVENAEGGSGAKAMSRVASARPDGSVLYASTPTYIMTSLLSRPGNTYRDLEPVVNFFLDTEVVYTRADGPYRTLEDVLEHARRGRGRWGAANPSSLERQAAERLLRGGRQDAERVREVTEKRTVTRGGREFAGHLEPVSERGTVDLVDADADSQRLAEDGPVLGALADAGRCGIREDHAVREGVRDQNLERLAKRHAIGHETRDVLEE
jgi:hypothetical protein